MAKTRISDGKIFARVPKAPGLSVHVRYRKVDGVEFVDIRDYQENAKTYGRGIMIPLDRERGDILYLLNNGLAELEAATRD